jgi:hypothetical protein
MSGKAFARRVRRLESMLPKNVGQQAIVVLPSGKRLFLVEARERLLERIPGLAGQQNKCARGWKSSCTPLIC